MPDAKSRNLQQFLAHSKWDARDVLDHVACEAGELIGDPERTGLLIDESSFANVVDLHSDFPVYVEESKPWRSNPQTKISLCNAPETMPLQRLAWMQLQRYCVERSFEDAKSECGMTDYQVRKWSAWHHHMELLKFPVFVRQVPG